MNQHFCAQNIKIYYGNNKNATLPNYYLASTTFRQIICRQYHGTTAATEVKSSYFHGRGSTVVVTRKIGYFRRRGSTMAVKKNLTFEHFLAPKALIICFQTNKNFFLLPWYFHGTTMAMEVSRKIGLLPLLRYYRCRGRSFILLPPMR